MSTAPVVSPKDEEEAQLLVLMQWMQARDLPTGELCYEVTDGATGEIRAVLDLAWPDGVQERLSDPMTVMLNEESTVEQVNNGVGNLIGSDLAYRCRRCCGYRVALCGTVRSSLRGCAGVLL